MYKKKFKKYDSLVCKVKSKKELLVIEMFIFKFLIY